MKCPFCGSIGPLVGSRIHERCVANGGMHGGPNSMRGTEAAKERARKALKARWSNPAAREHQSAVMKARQEQRKVRKP